MMKKGIALALSALLLVLNVPPIANLPPVRADDSDIFGANIQPNVLILIDTSQSMQDEVPTSAYSAGTTYSGSFTATPNQGAVYKYNTSNKTYTLYKNGISLVPNSDGTPTSAARDALTASGYWYGKIGGTQYYLFNGNYLNWKAAASPTTEPKITIAKRVITNLIKNTSGVRFGTMKFRSGGGEIISPVGSTTATLLAGVNALTAPGGFGTVLGEQIRDAGLYYRGQLGLQSPIQLECQPNFVIVVSDGIYTGIQPWPEAAKLNAQDHSSSLAGKQNIIVHTVGFGIAVSEPANELAANDALQQTAKNGGGTFYPTTSAAELEAALQDAMQQVVAATFSFATPVIPATSATSTHRAYLASFQSDPSRPAWKGFLKAYQRDSNGNIRVNADGTPDESFRDWEAGEVLAAKAVSSRTIKTVIGGTLQDFTTSNSNITPGLLQVASTAERDQLINYIRGVDTYDEDADGNVTEERTWKLGDIFHSSPVLVTPPFLPIPLIDPAPSYKDFKAANANRETVLIAGGNDGMLHAIRESDGQELWAFIPNDLLGSLKTLTATSAAHPFYVDGSPIAADVKIGGTWKTILVIGERRGGRFYHALDITDTTKPLYLWSFTDSKMGETWSEPAIGKVKMADGTERYVAIVGGGYDTTQNNNSGKALFGIDVATGQKLFEYFNTGSASDDRRFMNFSLPANPTAVDLNRDGFIDGVYIGDVGGQLWKYDFSPPATLSGGLVTNWTGKRFFAAPLVGTNPPAAGEYYPTQAIYGAPVPALDKINNLWIFFGAGDRNHPNNTTAPNRFYGIKDDTTMANGSTLTEANLANITASDTTPTQGWFFLLGSDEKILAAADVFNLIVFFSSFTPTTTAACETGGGTAKLYAVQMLTGYAALDWSLGVALTSTSASATRGKIIGTGIPSRPITVITESEATISTSVIAATTSQQLPSNPAPPPSAMRKVLYWREVF
jgi:type IV pilus assembly protein PilY1